MANANQLARQLAADIARAITAAASGDPHVEASRARARSAGFEIQGSLEELVASAIRLARADAMTRTESASATPHAALELTRSDIRLLRTLRIAVDQATEPA